MTSPAPEIPPRPLPKSEWKQRPERGNMAMLRLMTWISLRIGRAPARIILVGISIFYVLFAPLARHASLIYLRQALGRKPRLADLYRHFHSFAATIHDRVFLLNGRFDLFRIDTRGAQACEDVLDAGHGVFLMGAHLGSFEVVRALGRHKLGNRIAMVMYQDNALKINAALAAINPDAVQDIIALGRVDSMLRVQTGLDAGMLLGMLADRNLGNDRTLSVPFLGENAEFPLGPMRLAALLKRPVLLMAGIYLGGNHYQIRFEKLADFTAVTPASKNAAIEAAVTAYATCLENLCREAPYNWFNFYDFWRRKPPE